MEVKNPNNLPVIPIRDLLATQGNLKDLTEKNYNKLKNTIINRGFSVPVYVWEDSKGVKHLLDGHQRQRVLTTEGWNDPIPYLKIPAENIQEAMARLLEITSQYATITQEGIDEFIAKYELPEADVYEATSFDALTGFEDSDQEQEVVEDEAPEVDESEPPKSELGKIYQLGKHRVMCGDSTLPDDVAKMMGGALGDLVFVDPPYNIDYEGKTKKRLKIENDKFTDGGFYQFLLDAFTNLYTFTKKGTAIYIAHADMERVNFQNALVDSGYRQKQNIIWVKDSIVLGRQDYHWRHEPILYGWKDDNGKHKWESDRKQDTVWEVKRPTRSEEHPTMKPIELCTKPINNSSKKGEIVVDTFLGSGSTLIACEQTERICYGMELDPKYVDVIRKRYAKFISPDNELPENWEDLTPAIKEK